MLSERSQTKQEYTPYGSTYIKFQKIKMNHGDRKEINSCLGTGGGGRREAGRIVSKGYEERFGGDGYIHHLDCGNGFMSIHICQNHQIVHSVNLSCGHYTSVKLQKVKHQTCITVHLSKMTLPVINHCGCIRTILC